MFTSHSRFCVAQSVQDRHKQACTITGQRAQTNQPTNMLARSLIPNALKVDRFARFSTLIANKGSPSTAGNRENPTTSNSLTFTYNKHPKYLPKSFHTAPNLLSTYYTAEHEWLKLDDGVATIGITKHASHELGDIVYCDPPQIAGEFEKGDQMVVLESVKAVSYVLAPASGKVTDVNQEAVENPAMISEAPTEGGWLVKMKLSDESELDEHMDEKAYLNLIAE